MKIAPTIPLTRRRLLAWFMKNRRDLPWRRTHDPYLIAVSEVMLQQTQVDRVVPKFLAWKKAFPTTASLARAPLKNVLSLWSGLGYNSRGLRLRAAAQAVMKNHNGLWPKDNTDLEQLPGFGPYTARAVASFSYNSDVAVIDTNVRRVVSRIFFGLRKPSERELMNTVEALLPRGRSAEWNAALMDFGSAICTSRVPKCVTCPLQSSCRAYPAILTEPKSSKVRPSVRFQETDRYWRGELIRQLLKNPRQTIAALLTKLKAKGKVDKPRVVRLIDQLAQDGLIQRQGNIVRLSS